MNGKHEISVCCFLVIFYEIIINANWLERVKLWCVVVLLVLLLDPSRINRHVLKSKLVLFFYYLWNKFFCKLCVALKLIQTYVFGATITKKGHMNTIRKDVFLFLLLLLRTAISRLSNWFRSPCIIGGLKTAKICCLIFNLY